MVRKSFQKGYVDSRTTEEGTVHYLRYRLRDSKGNWAEKSEMLPSFESPKNSENTSRRGWMRLMTTITIRVSSPSRATSL